MAFRSGFVSIIGRPNAGKSTLLNTIIGEKLAIVTHKPQTTRNRIQGILNVKAKGKGLNGQIVFVDTPGIHKPENSLNKRMMQEVYDALEGCDLLLLLIDVTQNFGTGDEFALKLLNKASAPAFLVLNKIDLVEKGKLLPIIERYSKLHVFREIIPISALKGQGVDELLQTTLKHLPEGPRYFPKDQVTDQPERFLVAEIIREQVLLQTHEEVPYATTVVVERYEEEGKLLRISAAIYCEREGQKGIIIGRGGEMLKKIGTHARRDIERRLSIKVFLELFVKVRPGWRDSRQFVEELDWHRELEHLAKRRPE
jgi:GTP-binding protein Era